MSRPQLASVRSIGSNRPRWLRALFGVVLVAASTACEEEGTVDETPSIRDARAEGNGSEVTVEGNVTVQPGAFVSALGDEGFAIEDGSGGIYVKMTEKQSFGLGARVRVTGTLDEQNKLGILKAEPAGVEVLEGTQDVSPKAVGTGAVDEAVEGQLIEVTGTVTQTFMDDSPYGYKLYVDDGSGEVQIFVHVSAGLDRATLEAITADQSLTVVGLAAQYEDTYEVAPRQPSDLTVE
jgi:uncharacterized protein YdeI (BOF family)